MPATIQEKFADLFADPHAGRWLTLLCRRGKAYATLDAYGRAVRDYISFCHSKELAYPEARKDHIGAYIQHMSSQQVQRVKTQRGLSNATMQQRLVAVHSLYDFFKHANERQAFNEFLVANPSRFEEAQAGYAAEHAAELMQKEGNAAAISPLDIGKVVDLYNAWRQVICGISKRPQYKNPLVIRIIWGLLSAA